MLSDMIKSSRGDRQILKAQNEKECGYCGANTDKTHPTIHRITVCPKFAAQRNELFMIANRYRYEHAHKMLNNRMHAQTLLRILAKVANK